MRTVIIDTRSNEAKRMIEFLKSTSYAKVLEEDVPNEKTLRAMIDVENGKVKSYPSVKSLLENLKNSAGVQD